MAVSEYFAHSYSEARTKFLAGWGGTGKWFDARDPTLCGSYGLFLNHSGDAQGVRHQQGLHFSTASHLRVRWLKALAQFSLDFCAAYVAGDAINSPKILFSGTPDLQPAATFGIYG